MITIKKTQRNVPIDVQFVQSVVACLLHKISYSDFDIGIWFTTNKTIQKYNKRYRSIDRPTDILSFPYHDKSVPGERIVAHVPEDKNLGDLIISAEYVAKVARELNKPFVEHLKTILVHGICHLIGYDHAIDADYQRMNRFERKLLNQLNNLS